MTDSKSNIKRREKILSYITPQLKQPLYFLVSGELVRDFSRLDEVGVNRERFNLTEFDIKVLRTLKNAFSLGSHHLNRSVHTFSGKRRSAVDVWRHLLVFDPSTSIFDVMRSIYNLLDRGFLSANYCYVVKRTVFTYNETLSSEPLYSRDFVDTVLKKIRCREFGCIILGSWRKL